MFLQNLRGFWSTWLYERRSFCRNVLHFRPTCLKGKNDPDEYTTPIVYKEISPATLEASGVKGVTQADKDIVSEITGKAESPAPLTADQTPDSTFTYNMQHRRRGVFIIINNKTFKIKGVSERTGTDVDADKLEQMFSSLGFQVRRYDNQTCKDMLRIFQQGQ